MGYKLLFYRFAAFIVIAVFVAWHWGPALEDPSALGEGAGEERGTRRKYVTLMVMVTVMVMVMW